MPKFSEDERVIIQQKLFAEGERLFIQHGLKKVTVDDLVKATGIAKGSFYAFYTNKEHLYMDILSSLQRIILKEAEVFLQENCSLPPKERVKQLILWSYSEMQKHPLLIQQDGETIDYLLRKLPKDVLEVHFQDDLKTPAMLMKYGVTFNYDIKLVEKTLQALTITFFNLRNKHKGNYKAVIEIFVSSIANEIVRDCP